MADTGSYHIEVTNYTECSSIHQERPFIGTIGILPQTWLHDSKRTCHTNGDERRSALILHQGLQERNDFPGIIFLWTVLQKSFQCFVFLRALWLWLARYGLLLQQMSQEKQKRLHLIFLQAAFNFSLTSYFATYKMLTILKFFTHFGAYSFGTSKMLYHPAFIDVETSFIVTSITFTILSSPPKR